MICDPCKEAADLLQAMEEGNLELAAIHKFRVMTLHHQCSQKTLKQQTYAPEQLPSCACQHRVGERVGKLKAELQDV